MMMNECQKEENSMKTDFRFLNSRAVKVIALLIVSTLLIWPISAINSEGLSFFGFGGDNEGGSGAEGATGGSGGGNGIVASTQRPSVSEGLFLGSILGGNIYSSGSSGAGDAAGGSAGSGNTVDAGTGGASGGGAGSSGDTGGGGSADGDVSGGGTGNDTGDGGGGDTGDTAPAMIRVASYDELVRLINDSIGKNYSGYYSGGTPVFSKGILVESSEAANGAARDGSADAAVSAQAPSDQAAGLSGSGSGDHSTTNIQVEGVDEADIVKTDGEYIYQVNNNRVVIAKAYPAGSMEIVSITDFRNEKFAVKEIYIEDGMFIAIGSAQLAILPVTQQTGAAVKPGVAEPAIAPDSIYPRDGYFQSDATQALIYDLSDIRKPVLVRTTAIDGYYISSRKIGDTLYIVTNKHAYLYNEKGPEPVLPQYKDTGAGGGGVVQLAYDNIYYFPDTEMSGYLIVGAVPLKDTKAAAKVNAYLGAGNNVYASTQNLYVAVSHYKAVDAQPKESGAGEGSVSGSVSVSVSGSSSGTGGSGSSGTDTVTVVAPDTRIAAGGSVAYYTRYDVNTLIYKFGLNGIEVTFKAKGEVPGTILNQFSMDEYVGYFRIATTKGDVWGTGENISKNNIYVLDGSMKLTGKIEDIAPGEKIYSTRFMGKRVYMVTFRTVDPLFVIDLSDTAAPKILGALKIPGYSDYLHPYDENHIIGFGKDTAEVSSSKTGGSGDSTMSFYQGIKMALFDVTDVSNPVQKFSVIIGDRGTTSELLSNHKALMFSKEKGLLAFPVTLYEIPAGTGVEGNDLYHATQYGQFTFQGAYIYNIDLVNGFVFKGRITHMTAEDYLKAGNYFYNGERMVRRILYISDILYTLSDTVLRANRIDSMEQAGQVMIP